MSLEIRPVILSGGAGTRLWPLSRKSYPKQFALDIDGESLFQATARRLAVAEFGLTFTKPMVVTGEAFRFTVAEQLLAAGIDPGPILIEPCARNTAPAVIAAALHALKADPEAVLLVAPSDHVIPDGRAFRACVARARPALERGEMVTFGIQPDRAETGYGWLALPENFAADRAAAVAGSEAELGPFKLRGFVEKPDLARAEAMLAGGEHLWNAGIFLFRAVDLITACQRHAPALLDPVAEALEAAHPDLGFIRLAAEPWEQVADISIDHAVMERADNLAVVPFAGAWSDLGSWDAVLRDFPKSEAGVVSVGPVLARDCKDSLLYAQAPGQQLVGIGLEDMIAVAMPDAVLVAHRSRAQEVKEAVAQMKAAAISQAETLPRDYRPWGWYESLVVGGRFQVKRITVKPKAALSLQSHHHRSEHWIVVVGTARVTIDDETLLVTENQSVYIPLGARHRLENPGKVAMVLIEVQTGAYLGEDDIIRYEDLYARG